MAATPTRIYRITIGDTDRLVRAASQDQALMHVARDIARVVVASQDDLVECLTDGVKVESLADAGDRDDTPAHPDDDRTGSLFEAAGINDRTGPSNASEPAWPFPERADSVTPAAQAELNRQAQAAAERRARPSAPRFRNPMTGENWSGRGLKPRWLTKELESGRTLDEFALAPDSDGVAASRRRMQGVAAHGGGA